MPESSPQFEDSSYEDLMQALRWEADMPYSRFHFVGSLTLHALLLAAWTLTWVSSPPAPVSPTEAVISAFFAPRPEPQPVEKKTPLPVMLAGDATAQDAAEPPPPPPEVQVDFNNIKLSFERDTRGDLPQVVAAQRGMLALLDHEDHAIAQFLFRPPDWQGGEEIIDVSRSLRILMNPPDKWQVLRDIASREHIDLNRYQACAVFDLAFRRCLKDAILTSANQHPGHKGDVASARLAISAAQPCGIQVLEVSFADK